MVLHEFLESDYEVLQPDVFHINVSHSYCQPNTLSIEEFWQQILYVFKQIISAQFHNNDNI